MGDQGHSIRKKLVQSLVKLRAILSPTLVSVNLKPFCAANFAHLPILLRIKCQLLNISKSTSGCGLSPFYSAPP